MKDIIIYGIDNIIFFLKNMKKVDDALHNVGFALELFEGHGNPLQEFLNDIIHLVWKLILEERGVSELCNHEFEYYTDILYDLGYGDNSFNFYSSEDIYNYFINIDQIMIDFNIGKEDE